MSSYVPAKMLNELQLDSERQDKEESELWEAILERTQLQHQHQRQRLEWEERIRKNSNSTRSSSENLARLPWHDVMQFDVLDF
jgi:hypothetical protein